MLNLKDLTLEEKLKLLTGKNFWQTEDLNGKLPNISMADGPHGLRKNLDVNDSENSNVDATAYPNLSSIGNSWNKQMAYEMGSAIADDCIENDVDILLAPGVNMKRTPLCGRNFEYFSEDPFLSGNLACEYIKGVQDKGVGTSLKHFAVNNRECYRHNQNNEVDERTLREIYLKTFEIALKGKPWTVMCSYNPVNGIYASENKFLLDEVLRKDFGFDGVIVSDWEAVKDRAKSLKATLDLQMPYSNYAYAVLKRAYEEGFITDDEIDQSVQRILQLIEKINENKRKRKVTLSKTQRHEKAVEIARECIVLLKNEFNCLPLDKDKKINVLKYHYPQAFIGGGGSANVKTKYPVKLLDQTLREKGFNVSNIQYKINSSIDGDINVLCVGNIIQDEYEGGDRKSIRLQAEQENFIENALKINSNTIVVLYTGSAVDVSPWIDKVKCVVQAGFSGEGVNEALADILSGEVCPSGKLSETYPLCLEDTPTKDYIGNGLVENYLEGLFVGYRYYDKENKNVAFPFGYGLSYANFEYSNLNVIKESETDYTVTFDVTNVSNVDGREVSQLYVSNPISFVSKPIKELKGFSKDLIKAGKTKTITLKLDKQSFAYYNVNLKEWHVENGVYHIQIGSSSKDLKLSKKIQINLPDNTQYSAYNIFKTN